MSMSFSGARDARRLSRATISTAVALAAVAALAAPAGAAVNGSHVVATIPDASALELSGYPVGDQLDIHVVRNGVVIGSAADVTTQDPKAKGIDLSTAGILNVNGGTPPCWIASTPQILPGDTVTVGDSSGTDSMVVQNVEATSIEQDPITGHTLVHGFAIAPGGGRYDQATFDANVQARITVGAGQPFSNGRNNVRAGATKTDGTIAYDPPTLTDPAPTTWTANFPLNAADAALALANKNIEGVFSVGVSELTIGRTPVAGATAGCPPTVRNAVTSFDRQAVNVANVATALTMNGVAQADASKVSVTIRDTEGHTVKAPDVVPVNGSYTTAGIDVSSLSDGTLTATPTFTTPAQTFDGATLTILKDTKAPVAPVASPRSGNYSSPQSVSLGDDDASAKVLYTVVGTAPGAGSPAFGVTPITVDHSLTIRAIAIDAAGNQSPEASFAYTITGAPPGAGGGGGAPASTTTIIQQIPLFPVVRPGQAVQGVKTSAAARPALRGLTVAVGARHALRVSMRLSTGAETVRFRVYRVRNGRRTGPALMTLVRLAAGGRSTVTLRGRALRALNAGHYVLEAQASAVGAYGAATTVPFTIR